MSCSIKCKFFWQLHCLSFLIYKLRLTGQNNSIRQKAHNRTQPEDLPLLCDNSFLFYRNEILQVSHGWLLFTLSLSVFQYLILIGYNAAGMRINSQQHKGNLGQPCSKIIISASQGHNSFFKRRMKHFWPMAEKGCGSNSFWFLNSQVTTPECVATWLCIWWWPQGAKSVVVIRVTDFPTGSQCLGQM